MIHIAVAIADVSDYVGDSAAFIKLQLFQVIGTIERAATEATDNVTGNVDVKCGCNYQWKALQLSDSDSDSDGNTSGALNMSRVVVSCSFLCRKTIEIQFENSESKFYQMAVQG